MNDKLVDDIAQSDVTAKPVPTDVDGLAALLSATPPGAHDGIRDQLTVQLGDRDEAWRIYTEAASLLEHIEEIDRLRGVLREDLNGAETSILRALRVLDDLVRVNDVEYAEGAARDHMRQFLADAARMVCAARALNPCPEEVA